MFDLPPPPKLVSSLPVAQAHMALLKKSGLLLPTFHLLDYCVYVCWGLEKSLFPEVHTENYTGEIVNKLLCKCESLIRRWCS